VRSAVAGVNGDYFDYDRAGRAVPAGAQIRAGTVQRLPAGATRFVGVGDDGRVRAGRVRVRGSALLPPSRPAAVRPVLAVTAVNPAHLPSAGVAVVTGYLGRGRPAAAWEVVVRRGAVVFSGRRAPFGGGLRFGAEAAAVRGAAVGRDVLLAARAGPSASALARLRVGARVTVRWSARTQDGVRLLEAVGSGAAVLAGGRVVASCTGAGVGARARTVVAWDAAGRRAWLMAVDTGGMAVPVGRWGLTYHQVAELARRLGATDAALLDGGGSTTVVIRRGGGIARVDATGRIPQRAVPNGLVLVPVR
jgi:hypothetical protein